MSKKHPIAQFKSKREKFPGSVSLSKKTPKDNGVYSEVRLILHPGFMEIPSVVFVLSCGQTKQQMDGENLLDR